VGRRGGATGKGTTQAQEVTESAWSTEAAVVTSAGCVLRCLAKAPADRVPDVASLDAALGACASAGQWSPAQAAAWWRSRAGASVPAAVEGVTPGG
jgi:hypothetical protein